VKNQLLLILSVLALLPGCQQSGQKADKVFSPADFDVDTVSVTIHETDKIFASIEGVDIVDDYLVLKARDENGTLLFFDIKNGFEYSHTGGVLGRGPGEYLHKIHYMSKSMDSCFVSFISPGRTWVFSKDDFVSKRPKTREIKRKSAMDYLPVNGYNIGVSNIGASDLRKRFSLFDNDGVITGSYDHYPLTTDKSKYELWVSSQKVANHPTEPRFVSLFTIPGTVEIFNIKKGQIVRENLRYYGDTLIINDFKDDGVIDYERKVGFSVIYCTQNYIYMTYSGHTLGEFIGLSGTNHLVVMDWNANIKKVYYVEPVMRMIAVSPDDKKVWFSTLNDKLEDAVASFDL
jgi:hypothetical protein